MRAEEVRNRVGDIPYMRLKEARLFYDLINAHRLTSVLELGFFHGVSTAYLAGAVEECGGGLVTTVDLISAQTRRPNIEQLLTSCGLRDLVEIFYEPKTFNWRLMKFLEEAPQRSFDLCYIDGGHTWVETGFAFCLVRQLLRPGGWLVFDDITHTFRASNNRDKEWVRRMTEEEQVTAQVERVFSLLVMRDTNFGTFRRIRNLGIARRNPVSQPGNSASLFIECQVTAAADMARVDPALRHRLLQQPAKILSDIAGVKESSFRHIRFAESGLWSPLEPQVEENGIVTHFLERPDWDKSISEDSLLALIRD